MSGEKYPDGSDEMSESERAHVEKRDRKRVTKMVVDNAGVKKIAAARAAGKRKPKKSSGDAATQPP